ncbi:MAG: cbs domain containing protein [Cytophagales bacterium CG12_big_fil_rev_8_21_14_0_65_40_12]|nr:MAG: cbs domain containing protein [Cytophagales bacterium CG12_big_fil_rev_8_21_14_0_65_40_12]PIW04068.1 MAG: cbs domain containing protein [Cytophagales bacterium CG17_big_fil_post_rev_8_21_14_2_50_40_13]
MIAAELINDLIPPLKLTDDGHKAIVWMEELRTNQLPVVEKGRFLGFISEEVILENNDSSKAISEYDLFSEDCFVFEDQHFYDVIKLAHDHEVQLVAILSRNGAFLGVVTIEDTISGFAQSMAVQEPGAILIVSMNQRDYSLAEISRIVEGENAKILSSCITNDYMDATRIKLTLKINKPDLSHVAASIERFGYKIIGRFQELEIKSNDQERYDMLMKYLNI